MSCPTFVITHRGLDPSRPGFHPESSLRAFEDHIARGFGIEFDLHFAADGSMLATHDPKVERFVEGMATVPQLLALIGEAGGERLSALHIKSKWQDEAHLAKIADELAKADVGCLAAFDLKPEAARFLKSRVPSLKVAASVAHPYDIERYNGAVGGTLLSLGEAVAADCYDWAWLDEWDRASADGAGKALYTKETFAACRAAGLKVALVTPELHATSPGLLGGEAHPDAGTHESLMARIAEILALGPDAVCTDYPDEVKAMVG